MATTNKFQYFGIYKSKDPLHSLIFFKVMDVGTYGMLIQNKHGITVTDEREAVIVTTCDADGVYISPRAWGVLEEDCLCQPFIYPLKEFLELYEKYEDEH